MEMKKIIGTNVLVAMAYKMEVAKLGGGGGLYSLCLKMQRLGGQAKSQPPTSGAGNSGPGCHTLCPGRAPWGPCGPDRNRLPCRVLSLSHLKVKHILENKVSDSFAVFVNAEFAISIYYL